MFPTTNQYPISISLSPSPSRRLWNMPRISCYFGSTPLLMAKMLHVDVDVRYRCRLRYIPIVIITIISKYSHHIISYSHYKPIDCHYVPMWYPLFFSVAPIRELHTYVIILIYIIHYFLYFSHGVIPRLVHHTFPLQSLYKHIVKPLVNHIFHNFPMFYHFPIFPYIHINVVKTMP